MTTRRTRLVANPGLRIVERDGVQHLVNPAEGTLIRLTDRVRRAMAEPSDNPTGALARLRFVAAPPDIEVVAGGVAQSSDAPLGPAWHRSDPTDGWVVIGCAFAPGARPDANPAAGTKLVRSGLSRRLSQPTGWSWHTRSRWNTADPMVLDYGDIPYREGVDSARTVHARLGFAARQIRDDGARPLVLGGDHSVAYPVIAALADRYPDLRVLHLDAHADRAPHDDAQVPHCGNFMTCLSRRYPLIPTLTVGVRGFDSGFTDPGSDSFVTADELDDPSGMERVERFVTGHRIHLTMDVDVLDPAAAPEVAYPVPGGLRVTQVQRLLTTVTGSAEVVGADFSEVCAGTGRRNHAASALTMLITSLLEHTTKARGGTR